jgi:hypothetical protein
MTLKDRVVSQWIDWLDSDRAYDQPFENLLEPSRLQGAQSFQWDEDLSTLTEMFVEGPTWCQP